MSGPLDASAAVAWAASRSSVESIPLSWAAAGALFPDEMSVAWDALTIAAAEDMPCILRLRRRPARTIARSGVSGTFSCAQRGYRNANGDWVRRNHAPLVNGAGVDIFELCAEEPDHTERVAAHGNSACRCHVWDGAAWQPVAALDRDGAAERAEDLASMREWRANEMPRGHDAEPQAMT